MSEVFTIFVVDDAIDENNMEHYKVVQWSYDNLTHPNVISLIADDIFELGECGILPIISELNDSILGEGEDDWIIDNKIKLEVINAIKSCDVSRRSCIKIIDRLLKLLKYSIDKNRNIYFHF